MNTSSLFHAMPLAFSLFWLGQSVQGQNLRMHIDPSALSEEATEIPDAAGTLTAQLKNGASIRSSEAGGIIALGSQNGYVDLSEEAGKLIGSLEDFTIHTKVYVPTATNISGNGNFICSFSNAENILSDPKGYFFINVKDTRYAISSTDYRQEQTVTARQTLPQGSWQAITVVQKGTQAKLYLNGVRMAMETIDKLPGSLGETVYNWLGRSCYQGDAYLSGALIADFRIYDGAISSDSIRGLEQGLKPLDEMQTLLDLQMVADEFRISEQIASYTALPSSSGNVSITYASDRPDLVSPQGVVRCPEQGSESAKITLHVTFSAGEHTITKDYPLEILPLTAPRDGYTAYLFTYFTGNSAWQEQICYALSYDGYNYTPLNAGNPIISSDTIALKKAVRDPHILRGEGDGMFYMVVTDMRSSEGWSSNDGLVLMRSANLIDWQHTAIDFPTRWPDRFDRNKLTQVWAPQTIYDPSVGKYMVYYSIGEQGEHYKIYYSYANEDFTDLSEPQLLFDLGSNTIDADIVIKDGIYHLFYKTEQEGNGIQQATAPSLQGPWTPIRKYLQQTGNAVEGSGVFRLIDSNDWVLMYDCYTSGYYQFCVSKDLYDFQYVCDTRTGGNFTPRHGTVMPITAEEQARITTKWPGTLFDKAPEFTTGIEETFSDSSKTLRSRVFYYPDGRPAGTRLESLPAGYYLQHTIYTDGSRKAGIIYHAPSSMQP